MRQCGLRKDEAVSEKENTRGASTEDQPLSDIRVLSDRRLRQPPIFLGFGLSAKSIAQPRQTHA